MKFLHRLFSVVILAASTGCSTTAAVVPRPVQPNIVFILTDDMAVSDLAYMPKTIKLLEKKGATFDKFFVSMSLCCPSRTSILRGQYSQIGRAHV